MKKIAFAILLFCSFFSQVSAQRIKFSETVFKMGFIYEFYTFKPTQDSIYQTSIVPYYNFMMGGYLPVVHKNDIVSAGLDASLQGGINFRNGISYQLQLPVFAMGRLGANSTVYNEQKVGLAAGIGGMTSFISQKNLNSESIKILVFNPSAVVEVSMGGLIGRIQFSVMPYTSKISALDDPLSGNKWKTSHLGIGLIYRM